MNTQSVATNAVGAAGNDAVQTTAGARGAAKTSSRAQQGTAGSSDAVTNVENRDPRSLQFQVDTGSRQVVATIVDDSNQMVVVQIPDAEVLRIAKAIDRMKGFLIDSKA